MKFMENQKDWLLPVSVLIAGALVAAAVLYSNFKKPTSTDIAPTTKQDAEQISGEPQIDDDVVLGDPNAPVTIFVFGDYQCPFCGKFFKETEPLIRKNYIDTGKIKMVYKDFAFLGPESTYAAEAAECAKDQGKYWQYHDVLLEIEYAEFQKVLRGELSSSEGSGNLNRDLFKKIAGDLGMDVNNFLSCFDSRKYKDEVAKDLKEAKAAMGQQASTPTFFINGEMIRGAQPYEVFSRAIDEALNKK
jgi:protein-disulfide isomerase